MIETLETIYEALLEMLWPYLTEPRFYLQLLLFVLLVGIAWLLGQHLRRADWTKPKYAWQPNLDEFYFPVIGLAGGWLISGAFNAQDDALIFFEELYLLFWVHLFYRFGLTMVKRLRPHKADTIRRAVLRPLALLFVSLRLIGQMDFFFEVLSQPLFIIGEGTAEQINISLPLLILGPFATVTIYITSQGLRTILIEDILPTIGFAKSQAYAIGTLVSYVVIVIGTLFTLAGLGISPSSLTVFGSALAVGIGFGLQNTVNNFVSGFLIMFDPLLKVGDNVQVQGEKGVIRYIGVRNSMLETEDGTKVVLPNATLANSPVLNLNQSIRPCEVVLFIPLTFQANPYKVQDVIYTILTKHKEIRTEPEPSMTLLDFEHGSMNFELIFWVSEPSHKKAVTSALNLAIWEELGRLGYQFATPSGRLSKPQRSAMTTADLVDVDEEIEKLRDRLEIMSGE